MESRFVILENDLNPGFMIIEILETLKYLGDIKKSSVESWLRYDSMKELANQLGHPEVARDIENHFEENY
eukprot:g34489.t1